MGRINIAKYNKSFADLIRSFSGGMAAISTTILVLAAGSKLPTGGFSALYLSFTAISIPLLIASMLISFQIAHYEQVSRKADNYLCYLFSCGIATGICGYIMLLAKASVWTLPAFGVGVAVACYFYLKFNAAISE